jgi:hypothetical protein
MLTKRKTYVCTLDRDDEEKALDFEIQFQNTLTSAERFEMMFNMSNKMKEILIRNGYRRPVEIVKRP